MRGANTTNDRSYEGNAPGYGMRRFFIAFHVRGTQGSDAVGHFVPFGFVAASEGAFAGGAVGDLASTFEDVQARGGQAQGLESRGGIEDEEIGRFALFDAVPILDTQCTGRIGSDKVKHIIDLFVTAHVAEEKRELRRSQHVAPA